MQNYTKIVIYQFSVIKNRKLSVILCSNSVDRMKEGVIRTSAISGMMVSS